MSDLDADGLHGPLVSMLVVAYGGCDTNLAVVDNPWTGHGRL